MRSSFSSLFYSKTTKFDTHFYMIEEYSDLSLYVVARYAHALGGVSGVAAFISTDDQLK